MHTTFLVGYEVSSLQTSTFGLPDICCMVAYWLDCVCLASAVSGVVVFSVLMYYTVMGKGASVYGDRAHFGEGTPTE